MPLQTTPTGGEAPERRPAGLGTVAALALLALALACGLGVFLHHAGAVLGHPYPVDYGEGPLLDQAVRLADGQGIYRRDLSQLPYTVSNYPPLFPLLQAPFVRLCGPSYGYGRALALAGVLAAAGLLGATVWKLTRDRLAALLAGAVLLCIPYVLIWAPLARVDGLALGLSWAGLWILVRRRPGSRAVAVAALLFTAAAYTRQTYVLAAPLAALAWLLGQPGGRRRAALLAGLLAGLTAGLGLGLFVVLEVWTGGGFSLHVVRANVNLYDFGTVRKMAGELALHMPLLLLAGLSLPRLARPAADGPGPGLRPAIRLTAAYLAGAAVSFVALGKSGSNVNYLLELSAGLALAAGLWVGRATGRARAVLLLLLALQTAALAWLAVSRYTPLHLEKIARHAELDRLFELVRAAGGPVVADEYLGLLPLAGKPVLYQPFEMRHLARAGLFRQKRAVDALRQRQAALVLLYRLPDGGPIYRVRWSPHMLIQVQRHYVAVDEMANNLVYRPRPAGERGPAPR